MRKKIVLLFLSILLISLVSSTTARVLNTGDPYVPCLPLGSIYTFPATTIPAGQTVSFDIPTNPCPPVKIIQIGGFENTGQHIDADTAVIDQPTFQYQCTLSHDQGCCIPWGNVNYCTDGPLEPPAELTLYDEQGVERGSGQGSGCQQFGVYQNGWVVSRFEITNPGETAINFTATYETSCCYDCRKKQEPPATILYPKVDIEQFAVTGGATIIKDGKLLTNLELSPGTQQTLIQVENRGFFTQNDTRIRFEGLPDGVTVSITPETQKIKSQNLATYSATFTLGPNVPSGTYQVTLVAYSEKGMFDKIAFEFIVP